MACSTLSLGAVVVLMVPATAAGTSTSQGISRNVSSLDTAADEVGAGSPSSLRGTGSTGKLKGISR